MTITMTTTIPITMAAMAMTITIPITITIMAAMTINITITMAAMAMTIITITMEARQDPSEDPPGAPLHPRSRPLDRHLSEPHQRDESAGPQPHMPPLPSPSGHEWQQGPID